jgi:peptide/nickel transport system permease protein
LIASTVANGAEEWRNNSRAAFRQLGRLVRGAGGRETFIGATIVIVLVVASVFAPFLLSQDPNAIDSHRVLGSPSLVHPFGSDAQGRDVLTRILYAFRVSLSVAVGSTVLALAVSVPFGLVTGYVGGWTDTLLMRPIDSLLAFPALLFAVALIAVIGPGSLVALLAIAIVQFPVLTRVLRSSVLVTREQAYVISARARGTSSLRIMLLHVLPNSFGPTLAQASIITAFAIQFQAALSFIGLGAQPPTPELGLMLHDGSQVFTLAPWVEIYPGLALAIAALGFLLFGNGLSRRLEPAKRR